MTKDECGDTVDSLYFCNECGSQGDHEPDCKSGMRARPKAPISNLPEHPGCGFCYDSERGKNGPATRVWSQDWQMYIPMCQKHATESATNDARTEPDYNAAEAHCLANHAPHCECA